MLLLPLFIIIIIIKRFVNMLLIVCIPIDIEYDDLFANIHFENAMNA
jgi:hypothetical protein